MNRLILFLSPLDEGCSCLLHALLLKKDTEFNENIDQLQYTALIWKAEKFALQPCWRVFALLQICVFKH